LSIGNGRFTVYGDGKFKAANNKFSVDSDGNIKATGGHIGGWTINDTTLFGGGTTLNSDGTITCRNLQASIDGKIGGWHIGTTKLSSESGHIDLNNNGSIISDAWNIQPNGVATFTDVRISSPNSSSTLDWGPNFGVTGDGRMHALAGQIGGWTLDSSGFKGAGIQITPQAFNYGAGFSLDTSGNLTSGGSAKFGGDLSSSGNFSTSGNVNVKGSGRIGDCVLSNGHLTVADANIDSLSLNKLTYQGHPISIDRYQITGYTLIRPHWEYITYLTSLDGDTKTTHVCTNIDTILTKYTALLLDAKSAES